MARPSSSEHSSASTHPYALTEAQEAEFIDKGYLIIRECFSPELAEQLVRKTVVDRDPPPTYRDVDAAHKEDLDRLDLEDPDTWTIPRVYLETGRSFPIKDFSPKLWGALVSLIGGEQKIRRRTMGEQYIFNADFMPGPPPAMKVKYFGGQQWHIDEPAQYMTFEDRQDALALLILWSKVEPGGGGPLYTGDSLRRIVQQVEASELGVDSRGYDWGVDIASKCSDVAEFTGMPGDVLITHSFSLHAPQSNFSRRIRVLENPTIRTADPLDYRPDNPSPSPVESCVISRLANPAVVAPTRGRTFKDCAEVLLTHHPDYFLPGREQWKKRVDPEMQSRVYELDRALTVSWASRLSDQIVGRFDNAVERIQSAIAVLGEVFVNQLDFHAHIEEHVAERDFPETCWSRLFRGFVNCEGQNYALAVVLSRIYPKVEMFNTIDPATGHGDHLTVRVGTSGGWAFADAWSPNKLFYVESFSAKPLEGVPEYGELELQGDRPEIGVVSREAYEKGAPLSVAYPQDTRQGFAEIADLIRGGGEAFEISPAWTRYLNARMHHLMGDRIRTQDSYRELERDRLVGGMTGRICELFAKRTADGTILARL